MQRAIRQEPQQFGAPAHRGALRGRNSQTLSACGSVPFRIRARLPRCAHATRAAMATPNDSKGNDPGAAANTAIGTDTAAATVASPTNPLSVTTTSQAPAATASSDRRKREQHARERCATLAAAKVVPERPDVAGDRRRGAAHGEPVTPDDGIRHDAGNRERRQPARRHPALADVDDDGACGEAESLRAQRIGAARVAAAHRADVDPAQLPDRERADDRTQQVGHQDLEPEFQHQVPPAARGRKISASMQRTLPPPSRSMVGIPTERIVPCRSRRRRFVRREHAQRRVRHRDERVAAPGAQGQQVAGEAVHLGRVDADDLPAVAPEFLDHGRARAGVRDRIGADDRKAFADRHQHVGVVRRATIGTLRIEGDDAKAKRRGKLRQRSRRSCAAIGRRRRCAAAGRARGCPCPRGTPRAPRARRDRSCARRDNPHARPR